MNELLLEKEKSLPVLNALGKWLAQEIKGGEVLPKSAIGKAFVYTLHRRESLNSYLNDGLLEIDNNLVENAIRFRPHGRAECSL